MDDKPDQCYADIAQPGRSRGSPRAGAGAVIPEPLARGNIDRRGPG